MIDWGMLLDKRHPVPFNPRETNLQATSKTPQRVLTEESNHIDYFSQTVDYMAMSIKLRKSWQLSMEEQTHFAGFEFLSAGMVEEELKATLARDTGASSFRQTGGSFRARATA